MMRAFLAERSAAVAAKAAKQERGGGKPGEAVEDATTRRPALAVADDGGDGADGGDDAIAEAERAD